MSGILTWNSGTISSIGEIDYYSVFLTAGTFCDFYLQEEALYNGNIELQSSPGTAVAGQYSSSDLVTHTPSSSGTYYIEVSGSSSSSTGSYSVAVETPLSTATIWIESISGRYQLLGEGTLTGRIPNHDVPGDVVAAHPKLA
jgi:hypothetical protein